MASLEELPVDARPVLVPTRLEPHPASLKAVAGGAEAEAEADAYPWTWLPMCRQRCEFGADAFGSVMQNLIRNPNLLSSWLFRADMIWSAEAEEKTKSAVPEGGVPESDPEAVPIELLPSETPRIPVFAGFTRTESKALVRRMIPRNTRRDKPMLQTCVFYEGETSGASSLVVYLPHVAGPASIPHYHPCVRGVAYLYESDADSDQAGLLSVHFAHFPTLFSPESHVPLMRVALSLARTAHKHGRGSRRGYVKRVHHDRLVPQARVQDRYTQLKERHAARLVASWQETTPADKHVFEDLAIAAFLIELWAGMYGSDGAFPGFVDIGCGNGLLVHILNAEGYRGWGFDARARRSWPQYGDEESLRVGLLLPFLLEGEEETAERAETEAGTSKSTTTSKATSTTTSTPRPASTPTPTLDGRFPPGTFLIANHADELTVWTPLLAALAGCPFIAIPCCSHNLTGARFRAPPPKHLPANAPTSYLSASTYGSFVEWVANLAQDCGWAVEREMLRMPSTRNAALIGRGQTSRKRPASESNDTAAAPAVLSPLLTTDEALAIITRYGGAQGFAATVAKLAQSSSRGH